TGYVLNSEIVTLTAENLKNNNQPFAFTVEKNYEDTRVRGSINLTKKNDANTAQTMENRQFELTYTDNDGYTAWQSSIKSNSVPITSNNGKCGVTTDDSGKIALTDVPYGNYRLTEVFPPDDQYQGPKTIEITRQEVITGSTTAVEKELINTLRKASLTIEKTDTKGDHMPDVTFKLSGTNAYKEPYENTQVTSSTNGSLGKVTFNEIPIGTYTLEETQIGTATVDRDGYEALKKYDVKVESSGAGTKVSIKDFDAQDNVYIDLTTDKNNTYSIKNTPVTGEIKFTKKDSDGRDLTKMTFKLQQIIKDMNGGVTDGEAISMNQEDSTGSTICFKNVPYGNYKLVEETKQGVKSVDVGQILKADLLVTAASESTKETFTYQPSGTTTPPVVTNELNKADIYFTKINENGTTITEPITFKVLRRGTEIDNAKSTFVLDVPTTTTNYTAYKDALNNPVTATTSNGVLTVTGLVMGDYQLNEHLPNNAINQGADIVKVTFTVDAQGEISKLSKYDLATSALKPVTPITEEIKAGDLGTVVNNIRYGYVNLLKVSDEQKNNDNVKLPGTKFTIYTKSDTTYTPFVSDIVVDNNGNLRCNSDGSYGTAPNNKWLVYGTYYLKETGSLSVFKPNNNYYEFTLNENNTGHLGTAWISATGSIDTKGTVSYKKANPPIPPTTIPQTDTTTFVNNTARASISIAKKDAEKANEALSGAKFIVYDKNTPVAALIENSSSGTYDELSTEKRDTPSLINWVTDKSIDNLTIPYIKDNKLLAGTYQIKEISAPTDYTDVNRIVKTVKIDNQGNLTWYDGDQVSTTSTTSNQVTNTLEKARFSITKKDSNTDELLSGVTFTLTGKDHYNQELKTENEEGIKATTDKKGVATFTNIPAGWVNEKSERQEYILTETTPTGYKTATIYKVKVDVVNHQAVVTISENKSSTSTTITNGNYAIKNTPLTGEINFVKKDANTPAGHPLAGVEFRLYKKINDVVSTTPYQTAFSNTTGQVSFKEIPYGNYVIEEIAQDGLTVASNINITKDSSTYSISNEKFTYDAGIITNTVKTGSLTLTKKDQNGNQLEGIKFKLQRRSDKTSGFVVDVPVDVNTYNDFNATEYNYNSATVYTTANNGQLALTNIPYGDYKLIEGSATANLHQGEKLAEVAFKVNKEGTTTVISGATDNTVSNTVAYGTLNITKVFDGVANNGRNRPNAIFEIYSGTKATQLPYMTVKTDGTGELIRGTKPGSYGDFTNGISKDKWLLEGHYTLVEKSYDGTDQIYNVDQKQYTFDITADNQVATIGN
ncbi:MAG: SpaA isopeptide-forming pilin-related protein, partial [Eubacterium sp.]